MIEHAERRYRAIAFEAHTAHGICAHWLVDPARQLVEQYKLDEAFIVSEATGTLQNDGHDPTPLRQPARATFDLEADRAVMQSLVQNPA